VRGLYANQESKWPVSVRRRASEELDLQSEFKTRKKAGEVREEQVEGEKRLVY
jgi:hypothetical protein